jgi:hypothetical protein
VEVFIPEINLPLLIDNPLLDWPSDGKNLLRNKEITKV